MTMQQIYQKKRREMCEKRSHQYLLDFIKQWEDNGIYKKGTFEKYDRQSEESLTYTLCKIILATDGVSFDTQLWARKWLKSHRGIGL